MSIVIHAENLTRRFGELTAVDHLNLDVAEGEIFGLVGPDGAGKTTTMRLLCGLMDPTEGQAVVAGHDVTRELDQMKDQIGYMAQRFGLYTDLTVQENMDFYSDLFGISKRERDEMGARLLQMTRMEPFRKRPAGKLSGGMKQKLALMCTLLHKPRVLFLDEPTNGVDPVSRRDFWAILYQLVRGGLTVFVTTAYLDEAERANRVGFLYQGKMIRCDTPAALKRGISEAVYLITSDDHRKTMSILEGQPGVLAVQPAGADLHLFIDPQSHVARKAWRSVTPFGYRPIVPSLEDVFIALARKEECAEVPPNNSGPAVHIDKLVKRFGDFVAVDNVSIDVAQGEIFGFLGPNGAGKSTTIRILCGLACSNLREGHGGRLRCGDAARRDQKEHRLHVAEVFALRRSEGGREYRIFRRRLWRPARQAACAARLRAQNGRPGGQTGDHDTPALGRMEATARARLRDPT